MRAAVRRPTASRHRALPRPAPAPPTCTHPPPPCCLPSLSHTHAPCRALVARRWARAAAAVLAAQGLWGGGWVWLGGRGPGGGEAGSTAAPGQAHGVVRLPRNATPTRTKHYPSPRAGCPVVVCVPACSIEHLLGNEIDNLQTVNDNDKQEVDDATGWNGTHYCNHQTRAHGTHTLSPHRAGGSRAHNVHLQCRWRQQPCGTVGQRPP